MSDEAIWDADSGTYLRVVVRPNSNERELIREMSRELIVFNLKNTARKGKANSELVKRLADTLDISNSDVVIAAGHLSREKTLVIYGMKPDQVRKKLLACTTNK